MQNLDEAFRMLDTFVSVGARSFVVTKTDISQNLIWGKTYSAAELREKLPSMVRTAGTRHPVNVPDGPMASAGENLIFRPKGPNVAFIQLDDLGADQLDRVRPAAFLIHATSPGNHQAWIAVSDLPNKKEVFKEFTRHVRKAVGTNDKSASHATRVAGTENFKIKYIPDFPTVTILETNPGRVMTTAQLETLGLVAPGEPAKTPTVVTLQTQRRQGKHAHERQWPDYQRCVTNAPQSREGNGPDRSMADFFWCMMAAQRGWSVEETASKLLEVSAKAQERARLHDEGYALITAQNAAAATARGRQRGRG